MYKYIYICIYIYVYMTESVIIARSCWAVQGTSSRLWGNYEVGLIQRMATRVHEHVLGPIKRRYEGPD